MSMDRDSVRNDFDQIAELPDKFWNHNNHYTPFIKKQIPVGCQNLLEVGCGKGALCKALSNNADQIIGIDLSPKMIEIAQLNTLSFSNIQVECLDYFQKKYPPNSFDCVVSVATVHHFDFSAFLRKVQTELKPRGRLIIIDLYEQEGFMEKASDLWVTPVSQIMKLVLNKKVKSSQKEKEIWEEHGKKDHYLTIKALRNYCNLLIPSAVIKKLFFWRYALIWTKS